MSTFSDKPLFTLKQLIGAIAIALTIGGGIARFELKTDNIETKLDTILASMENSKRNNDIRFEKIESTLLAHINDIRAITTSLTALKPEEVEIKKR